MRDVELLADHLERARHARLAHRAQAVGVGACRSCMPRAPSASALQHVLPAADAAVEPDLGLAAHRLARSPAARGSTRSRRRAGGRRGWRPRSRRRRAAAAIFASSASRMPLRISLPPQSFFTHSTSFQDSVGSNWPAIHCDSVVRLFASGMRPSRLPKDLRLPRSTFSAQAGLRRMSNAVRQRQLAAAPRGRSSGPGGAGPGSAGRGSAPAPSTSPPWRAR